MHDPLNLTPFQERRYKPVVDGVRHLTGYVKRPAYGRVVTLLCGDSYLVVKTGRVRWQADCLACHQARQQRQGIA